MTKQKERKKKRKEETEEILKVVRRLAVKMVFVSYSDSFSPIAPMDSYAFIFAGGK